jgi:hypothetical protein
VFITGDVDLPTEVLQGHADGNLVLFVGAGVSLDPPSNLMSFRSLARQVAESRHVSEVDAERFSARPDQLFGFLEDGDGSRVIHQLVAGLLTPAGSEPNSNHLALIRIASSSPKFRIVTTNFDCHLSTAADAVGVRFPQEYVGPALPLGRSFDGLVHLHGSVLNQDGMVLTDKDVGNAYLTDAWAARFLYSMFSEFVVVFVGYSHADIDMWYLARGLPRSGRRYIFTDDAMNPEWLRLGISAIAYPSIGPDHSALTGALEAWAKLAEEGGLRRRERVRDIVSTPPSAEQHLLDYLSWALQREDGANAFCDFADSSDWLDWLVDDASFAPNWSQGEHGSVAERLGTWFATAATSSVSAAAALRAIQRHPRTSGQLWVCIARALNREVARDDPELFAQWVTVLLSQKTDLELVNRYLTMVTTSATWKGNRQALLLLWEAALQPRLILEPSFSIFSDDDTNPCKPSARISWIIDDYWSDDVWSTEFRPNFEDCIDELTMISERALRTAVALSRSYSGSRFDALTFRRSAIEKHDQDSHRQTPDVLIDILRDGLHVLASRSPEEALLLIHRWLGDDHPLFQRLGIYGLGAVVAAPDITLDGILSHELLFALEVRHETWMQLRRISADLSPEGRARLIGAALAAGLDDKYADRSRYDLFNWLVDSVEDWLEVRVERDAIHKRNPEWVPRADEGMSMVSHFGLHQSQPPLEEGEFRRVLSEDPNQAIDQLLGFEYGDAWDGRSRWSDGLGQLSSAVTCSPTAGVSAWNAVAQTADKSFVADLQGAILRGWSTASEARPWTDILSKLNALESTAQLEHEIARLLESGMSGPDRIAEDDFALALSVSIRVWDEQIKDFESVANSKDWFARAVNEWPGILTGFWIYLSSAALNGSSDHSALEPDFKKYITQLTDANRNSIGGARAMLGRDLAFLDVAFEDLVTSRIFPAMSGCGVDARQYWDGFLYNPRIDLRMIRNEFDKVIVAFASQIGGLSPGLQRQFLSVVVITASASDVDGFKFMGQVMASIPRKYRGELLAAVWRRSKDEPEDSTVADDLWESWMSRLGEELLTGAPVTVSSRDWSEFATIVVGLRKHFVGALPTVLKHTTAIGRDSSVLRNLKESGKIEEYPNESFVLLKHLLAGEVDQNWIDYKVKPLVFQIGRHLGRDAVLSLVEHAIEARISGAGGWIDEFDAKPTLDD